MEWVKIIPFIEWGGGVVEIVVKVEVKVIVVVVCGRYDRGCADGGDGGHR